MGYACPVCEIPQRDGEHLAHHLAFTAMLHGEDHEAWLDDHVDDWAEREPEALAADVTPHAEDAEYHEVFEDTTQDHDRGRPDVGHQHGQGGMGHNIDTRGEDVDAETAAVLEEARELTREMLSEDDGETDAADDPEAADADPEAADSDTDADA
ncbi:DUF5810 domain-containing protein [Haloparvum sp. PAK95]|uniref:DUF5810 domain-containing protein n=1 Tax=Haloparvum sp. PAK95 TaxID=3418962 RepID=UPI003D2EE759